MPYEAQLGPFMHTMCATDMDYYENTVRNRKKNCGVKLIPSTIDYELCVPNDLPYNVMISVPK